MLNGYVGQVGHFGKITAFTLAALMVPAGGCDSSAALPPVPLAAISVDAPRFEAPEARYQADPARNRVWSLTRDGVTFHDRSAPEKIFKVPLPGWQWAGSPYGCLPDLALGPKGEAVITSDVLPTLWRIDAETLAVSEHRLVLDADTDKDVGFSGLTYSPMQGVYFAVSHAHGSLWRIDPEFRRGQKIPLSNSVSGACGLTARQNIARGRAQFLAGLCVSVPQGSRAIDLAPDQRSAYLRSATCKAT